jgi:dUTP diphosphatase
VRRRRSLYWRTVPTLRVPITRLAASPDASLPEHLSDGAAGLDLPAAVDTPVRLDPGRWQLIGCGFAIAIPPGFEGQVRPRSGLASRHGVTVLNAPGTIDSDYRGEVKVLLVNHGPEPFEVTAGMRIAQLVIAPVTRVEWEIVTELPDTSRGSGGFGHTGH